MGGTVTRVENVTPVLKERFLDAVMPRLERHEQLVAGLAMRPSVEERVAQALPLLERWGWCTKES